MSPTGTWVDWIGRLRRNRLVLLFFLLAFVAVAVNVKLIVNATAEIARTSQISPGNAGGVRSPDQPYNPDAVHAFRNQLWVLLAVTILCFGSMMYLLVTRLILPLTTIEQSAKEIAEGNLNVNIPSYPRDELGELGQTLNSVAANFQEVLLLMGTAVGHSYARVEKIEQSLEGHGLGPGNDVKDEVAALRKDLEMLGGVLKDFRFYQARFDGRKVVPHGPDA